MDETFVTSERRSATSVGIELYPTDIMPLIRSETICKPGSCFICSGFMFGNSSFSQALDTRFILFLVLMICLSLYPGASRVSREDYSNPFCLRLKIKLNQKFESKI